VMIEEKRVRKKKIVIKFKRIKKLFTLFSLLQKNFFLSSPSKEIRKFSVFLRIILWHFIKKI
jgi:uncharacterized protein YjbK